MPLLAANGKQLNLGRGLKVFDVATAWADRDVPLDVVVMENPVKVTCFAVKVYVKGLCGERNALKVGLVGDHLVGLAQHWVGDGGRMTYLNFRNALSVGLGLCYFEKIGDE